MTETDPAALAAFIGNQRTEHHVPHRLACRVLGVSESWFYKWSDKPTTAREVRRGQLADAIRQIFENSGGTYGSPKVWLLLIRAGWRVSVNTVARLMAELGLAGRKIRRRGVLTRPGKRPAFADFVRRDFTADAPDQVWCGDMTEISTGEGKYGSRRFRWACRRLGVTQSMGRVGSCFDYAVSEAFNSVLKVEYVHRHTFASRTEARLGIATWITGFYNTHRLHSVCGYRSPIDYEHDHRANSALELAA
ncbi:IS3 family transposase [Streptomyces mirabilis]|uniref:IS3 family transposase n=1 Tax=Streptomyces mirabilis TaxID=68239 RepID=UPI00365B0E59